MENNTSIENPNHSDQFGGITYEHREKESLKAKLMKFAMWVIRVKQTSRIAKRVTGDGASSQEEPEPPQRFKKKYDVNSWQVEGRNVSSIAPKENKTKKHVMFLHGGAYAFNATLFHWNFIERLIDETHCTVIAPDYPLTPLYTYLDSYKFIDPVYKKLISEVNPKDVVLMGDSAGGGLSLGLAQKAKQEGLPQPGNIILLSPWLDVTCSNPEMIELDKDEVLQNIEHMKLAGQAYTKGGDINSYLVSPINGPLEGLGKISLFIGTHDVLYADAKRFKRICDQKKIGINYYVYPKMMHNWMLFGFTESDHVIQQIKHLIL